MTQGAKFRRIPEGEIITIYAALGNLHDAVLDAEKAMKDLHKDQTSPEIRKELISKKETLLLRFRFTNALFNNLIHSQNRA